MAAGQFAADHWAHLSHCFSSVFVERCPNAGSSGHHRYDLGRSPSLGIDTTLLPALGILRCFTTDWGFLLQREVCPVIVVVMDVFAHQSPQMLFVEYDHMVKQIAAATPNPAFGNAVLPRTPKRCPLRSNPEVLDRANDFGIEIRSAIKEQIAGCPTHRAFGDEWDSTTASIVRPWIVWKMRGQEAVKKLCGEPTTALRN